MQARGVTEKAYVEQCKGGAKPTAAAPVGKPTETAPPSAPRQTTATGSKTAKRLYRRVACGQGRHASARRYGTGIC
jgi:hypothetical protein